jgi:hypothetical protein
MGSGATDGVLKASGLCFFAFTPDSVFLGALGVLAVKKFLSISLHPSPFAFFQPLRQILSQTHR